MPQLAPPAPVTVPWLGWIAAGEPIDAVEVPEPMAIPEALRGRGDSYVLRVRGDSMADEGIFDGDWIVVERREQADEGELVVALVDGETATLKRFHRHGPSVTLAPANAAHAPLTYAADRVRIQGVVIGQMRAYR